MNLADKYRPAMWSDVVGQGRALAKLDRLRQHGCIIVEPESGRLACGSEPV